MVLRGEPSQGIRPRPGQSGLESDAGIPEQQAQTIKIESDPLVKNLLAESQKKRMTTYFDARLVVSAYVASVGS